MANSMARWQGLNHVGSFPPTWVCKHVLRFVMGTTCFEFLYFSILAIAFCPNLDFYRMYGCMPVSVLMAVFMCFYWHSPWYGKWHSLAWLYTRWGSCMVVLVGDACWASVWNACGIKCVLCAASEGGGLSVWRWGRAGGFVCMKAAQTSAVG